MSYRQFYEQYLDLPGAANDRDSTFAIDVHCPWTLNHTHGDRKASAGINFTNGYFNCFRCGPYSPTKFLSQLLDMPFQQAAILVDDYRRESKLLVKEGSFTNSYVCDPRWTILARQSKEKLLALYTEENESAVLGRNLIEEYCQAKGLRVETLIELGVGYLPGELTYWHRSSLVFPYVYNGKVAGIRYRDFEGNKGGEPNCHFCLWGADTLDDSTHVAIIKEGETDRLRVYQELKDMGLGPEQGIRVVSTPSARWKMEWEREFEGIEHKILIPQADDPSIKMVEKAQVSLGEDLQILRLQWRRHQLGKDTTEWFAYNDPQEFRLLIEGIIGERRRLVMTGMEFQQSAIEEGSLADQAILEKLFSKRQIGIIAGGPKAYKTFMALEITRSLIDPDKSEWLGIPGVVRHREAPCKVLFVEEEGNRAELYDRAVKVLGDLEGWLDNTVWMHRASVKLDEEAWIKRLERTIKEHSIDVVFFDPFQDLHSQDEDSNTEMAKVWRNVKRLTSKFPNLAVWVIHHFTKAGILSDKWTALRGAGRNSASADVGIFVEKNSPINGLGNKFCVDGRSLSQLTSPDGTDIFQTSWEGEPTLRLRLTSKEVQINKHKAFIEEMRSRKTWTVEESALFFACSTQTIHNWMKKPSVADVVQYLPSAPGKKATLHWVGK